MRKRILVVEDEPDNAALLKIILDAEGYDVLSAEDLAGTRTLLACGEPPDLVVVDLLLPDGDGLDVCREVKARWPGLPVLALTAAVCPDVRERVLAAGCDGFLAKPFESETLGALVRAALRDAADRERTPRAG